VRRSAIVAASIATGLLGGALAPPARADGDPASDYLLVQDVFFPLNSEVSAQQEAQLTSIVRKANRAGFTIRVAVIATTYDMGLATVLYRRPRSYAHFLGAELELVYKGRLLVVMPNGFGFNWPKHPASRADEQLAKIPIRSGTSGLLGAAATAVERLAADAHVDIAPTPAAPVAQSHATRDRLLIVAVALAAILAAVTIRLALRRRHG